jgi:16S rRNA (cytosine1402-N4)-methyltransferase
MRSPSTDIAESSLSAGLRSGRSGRNPDGTPPVEGLRMTQDFSHQPVMVDEIVDAFAPVGSGLLVDATVGGGGHSRALLTAYPHLRVLGLDRDGDALAAAATVLAPFGDRVRLRHARFDALASLVAVETDGGATRVSGVLFDLGVSSPQLDIAERGFSYRTAGPLDMRMDRSAGLTAADVVNSYAADALVDLFVANGESRWARRIARAIVAARPVADTVTLAEIVSSAIPAPARRRGGHPATRVFQAIRIEVNSELDVLGPAIDDALELLAPGGRCVVLAYHSGEDRLVKQRFVAAATGGCTCPPGLPCGCGAVPRHRLINRGARKPSAAEVAANRRSESARLRVIERLQPDTDLATATQEGTS